jgi:Arc/MetJ family transcription regulator
MRKRTTMDLDMTLVSEVAAILHTRSVNETVHGALREAIESRRRMFLADLDLSLTTEQLEADRTGRVFAPKPRG